MKSFKIKLYSTIHSKVVQKQLNRLGHSWADSDEIVNNKPSKVFPKTAALLIEDGNILYADVEFYNQTLYTAIPWITTDELFQLT